MEVIPFTQIKKLMNKNMIQSIPIRPPNQARLFLVPFLVIGVILFFLLELGIGSVSIPILGTVKALFNLSGADETWTKIIHELRLPRTIAAAIGGLLWEQQVYNCRHYFAIL